MVKDLPLPYGPGELELIPIPRHRRLRWPRVRRSLRDRVFRTLRRGAGVTAAGGLRTEVVVEATRRRPGGVEAAVARRPSIIPAGEPPSRRRIRRPRGATRRDSATQSTAPYPGPSGSSPPMRKRWRSGCRRPEARPRREGDHARPVGHGPSRAASSTPSWPICCAQPAQLLAGQHPPAPPEPHAARGGPADASDGRPAAPSRVAVSTWGAARNSTPGFYDVYATSRCPSHPFWRRWSGRHRGGRRQAKPARPDPP